MKDNNAIKKVPIIIATTPEEVKKRAKLGDPFLKTVLEKGNVLYAKE